MSRIHEALQRASLERGKSPASGELQIVEPTAVSTFNEPPAPRAQVSLENIAEHPWNPSVTSLPTLADRGAGVEQFRSLRSHIYQARYEAPLKTIVVASGMPAEGKSFTAANLAVSLARNSIHNILLIDADLRRPTLHDLLGAPKSPGLSNYLDGNAEIAEVMQRLRPSKSADGGIAEKIANLTFIPSGGTRDNSSELVASPRMKELIDSVSPDFDWIVIDVPPVLAVTDAVEVARAADAVLLVARGAYTRYEVAQRAKAAFGLTRILGFVLNAVRHAPGKESYNYTYNYYHAAPEAGAHDRQKI